MAEDVELSSQQTDRLLQFQDLTGIEDIERCRNILESHGWDIEIAVQDTLNMREGTPSVFRPPSNSPPPVVVSPPNQRVYYDVRSWQPAGALGWGYFILTLPFHLAYNTIISITRFFLSLLRSDPRNNECDLPCADKHGLQPYAEKGYKYIKGATDPLRDVTSFIRAFEAKYGTEHPVLYQGTYHQALNDAKRDLKFLLVYLHGEDHQDTDEFCRRVLGNSDVISYINVSMLFWACSVNLPEGYKVSQALRENTYPFLAVIVLRDNKMTVVARLEGPTEPDVLLRRLRIILTENEASLMTVRLERQERTLNQTLRQQQDEAYEESLRIDQEKERKRREVQERRDREEMELREQLLAEQRQKEEIQQQKIELASQIPEEPPKEHPDTVCLVIKLPTGRRLERRFNKNDSMKHLYYFVFCHEESPDNFQIVTNFPRRVIPCEPTVEMTEPQTFAEYGFGASEMLFVQDLEA